MTSSLEASLHVMQTEFANPQLSIGDATVLLREGRLIPRLDLEFSEAYRSDLGDRRAAGWAARRGWSGIKSGRRAGRRRGREARTTDVGDGEVDTGKGGGGGEGVGGEVIGLRRIWLNRNLRNKRVSLRNADERVVTDRRSVLCCIPACTIVEGRHSVAEVGVLAFENSSKGYFRLEFDWLGAVGDPPAFSDDGVLVAVVEGGLLLVRSFARFFGESVGATAEFEGEFETVGGGGAGGEFDAGATVVAAGFSLLPFVSTSDRFAVASAVGVAFVVVESRGGAILSFGVARGGAGGAGRGSRGGVEEGDVAFFGQFEGGGVEEGGDAATDGTAPLAWSRGRD